MLLNGNLCAFNFLHFVIFKSIFALSPLVTIEELKEPKAEQVVRLEYAEVVVADYLLIRADFPELSNFSDREIDQWLVNKTAYISIPQTRQSIVNSAIGIIEDDRIEAYRPYCYGRALVFKSGSGLIDVKGAGTTKPAQYSHGNGLATLGEMLREFAYEKMISGLFAFDQSGHQTVGSYAVLAFDFLVKHQDGRTSPAGAILRQAHDRYEHVEKQKEEQKENYNFLPAPDAKNIELILRKYGIT